MGKTLTGIFALALLLPGSFLEAQQIPSPFRYIEETQSAGFFAGYLWTNPAEEPTGDGGIVMELGPRSAPIFGARYNIRFGGPFTGEASLGFIPSERTVYARDTTAATQVPPVEEVGTTGMAILLAEAGVRFHLTGPRTWNGLAPFVVGTGGLVGDLSRTPAAEAGVPPEERFRFGPGFAVALGMGTDWFPTRRLSVRAEARNQLWRVTAPAGLRPEPRENTQWTHNIGVSLGAALHF